MSILSCFSSVPLLSSCHGIVTRSPVGLNTRVPGGGGSSSPTGVPGGGGVQVPQRFLGGEGLKYPLPIKDTSNVYFKVPVQIGVPVYSDRLGDI